MPETLQCDVSEPGVRMYSYAPPRISGSAMPTGVFLSTGNAGTAGPLALFVTGATLAALGLVSVVPVYVIVWLVDQHLHLSLTAMLLQVGGPGDLVAASLGQVGINLLSFVSFLTLLRLSPLSGYHAAEHMTVHAIERYGVYGWEPHVAEMSPVHGRCGSNLLAGILPTLLVGAPLYALAPLATLAIALASWRFRHVLGSFLQRVFTTKPPTAVQLERGIDSGRRVLAGWLAAPKKDLPLIQRIWHRGAPPLVAGVAVTLYLMGMVGERLPGWLDW